jgi:hypothetical protein
MTATEKTRENSGDKPIPHQIWQPLFLYYIDLSFFQNRIIISALQQLMMQQWEKVHILFKLLAMQKQAVS